ncbi:MULTISPECIES: hypothetical protein [unclassified Exiguobacterium]|uniref:hypothetical protein n=1 Tax=unclassified Exiguobacterium TaxID=2644629 RepID=UPI001BECDE13|nr:MULTISPECIES: hypothetical protein [unclassified Exiguobacterium]
MIEQFKAQYNAIMDSAPGRQRDLRLAALMTELERKYRIPALKDEQWESANPAVIELYREVSQARAL